MKISHLTFLLLISILFTSCNRLNPDPQDMDLDPQEELYFPPLNSDAWESTSIEALEWNQDNLQPLLDFLEEQNSKSFIILHNGKIVVEEYFNGHSANTPWYWASAGKTLTTSITGIAQGEGFLSIDDKVSDYLGTGWTSAPLDKENLITCKNLLSMTSGLDDGIGDDISPENLQYLADAGDRWAYHNVHGKLQDVVAEATNEKWSDYFDAKLKDRIGMSGAWISTGNFDVYWSTTRSMARFGLLALAEGKWVDEQIIPVDFFKESVSTSQDINQAYGYMWWINGKSTFRLPQTQLEFSGSLIDTAPDDMYAGLGKNDQKVYVIPSENLVVIRMGDAAEGENFALSDFDEKLWERIMALIE